MTSDRIHVKSVLVATDLSPGAANALARSVLLPFEHGATLWLVHVLPESLPDKYAEAVRDKAGAALRNEAAALRRMAEERGTDGPGIECALLTGKPHVEIIRHARAHAADLVVVGRHGRQAVGDTLVGSTAERVIRKGDVPVLVVKQEAKGPYRRALVAIDLTDTSRREADLALALLPEAAREIALVHAYHVAFENWFSEGSLEGYRREHVEHARQTATRLAALLGSEGVDCRVSVHEGDPRVVVLREAAQEGSDLIVLGTHGRAGLAHALLGSVAEWLIRASPCDVAVTRPARFTFELP